MAYTQDQINAAYAAERANGATDADLARVGAEKYGVTADQFAQASQAYGNTPDQSSYSWASSPAPSTGGLISNAVAGAPADRFSQAQYDTARQWATGKSFDEIGAKASELGLTAGEVGKIFGQHGGSAEQVMDKSKYGTDQWGTSQQEASKWTFDGNGWTYNDNKTPTGRGFSTASVTPWTVDRNQTVQGQAYDIIAADSPLMQQARGRALQAMNERGLINSSIGIQAGQDAVMDRALQIATPDAATYASSAQFNANANNTNSMFNAGQSNQYDLANRELAQKQSQFDTTTAQKNSQFDRTMSQADQQYADTLKFNYKQLDVNKEVSLANGQNSLAAAGISASTQREIAAMNNDFKLATMQQDKANATTSAYNTQYDKFITKITNITMDKDLSSEAKNNMINSEVNVMKGWAAMNGVVGDLSYLDAYATGSKKGGVNPSGTPAPAPSSNSDVTGGSGGE